MADAIELDRKSRRLANEPMLVVDADPRQSRSVSVLNLHPGLMAKLKGRVPPLRVRVMGADGQVAEDLPDICGHYQVLRAGIRFTPRFPFDTDIRFRATFDVREINPLELSTSLSLEFSFPSTSEGDRTQVEHVFPRSDELPENLLRFYVCFSNPMRRGGAAKHIELLGPDDQPALDVLYRPPLELWDRSMRCLTILLDPGRLKRGLGPNRELGPPLKIGEQYTLVVHSEMLDQAGRTLRLRFCKPFQVARPVREPVEASQWKISYPTSGSRECLSLMFPRSLDWALLRHFITITTEGGEIVDGRISVGQNETLWSFTPTLPWAAGSYEIRADARLEDACGNSLLAAFDRPLRPGSGLAIETGVYRIPFHLVH
jgi:hypothetical protein